MSMAVLRLYSNGLCGHSVQTLQILITIKIFLHLVFAQQAVHMSYYIKHESLKHEGIVHAERTMSLLRSMSTGEQQTSIKL